MGKFAEKVKTARLALNIGVRELGGKLGISAGYISRIEARGEIPAPELICKIGELLGLDLDELLGVARDEVLSRKTKDLTEQHTEVLRLYRRRK